MNNNPVERPRNWRADRGGEVSLAGDSGTAVCLHRSAEREHRGNVQLIHSCSVAIARAQSTAGLSELVWFLWFGLRSETVSLFTFRYSYFITMHNYTT